MFCWNNTFDFEFVGQVTLKARHAFFVVELDVFRPLRNTEYVLDMVNDWTQPKNLHNVPEAEAMLDRKREVSHLLTEAKWLEKQLGKWVKRDLGAIITTLVGVWNRLSLMDLRSITDRLSKTQDSLVKFAKAQQDLNEDLALSVRHATRQMNTFFESDTKRRFVLSNSLVLESAMDAALRI